MQSGAKRKIIMKNSKLRPVQKFQKAVICFFLIFIMVSGGYAEDGHVLTLEECVKTALANNPRLQQAVSGVDLKKAGIGVSRSDYLPQITTSGKYSHDRSSKLTLGASGLGGAGIALAKKYNTLSEESSLDQLIWDFGKTLNAIKLSQEDLTTAQCAFLETQEDVTLRAEKGYFNALKAQLLLYVAEENLRQLKVHLERTKGFYEVGFKQGYDVTKAELNLAYAALDLAAAKKDYGLTISELNNIMGKTDSSDYRVAGEEDFNPVNVSLGEAIKTALANRVEMSSRRSEIRARQIELEIKKKSDWPTVSAGAAHKVSDTDVKGAGNVRNWNAGAAIRWPWFDGLRTRSEVKEAEARLTAAQSKIQEETLNIILEVREAVLNLGEAEERINAAAVLRKETLENLDVTNARYEEGLGSIIEVTDAEVSFISAKRTYAAAVTDYLICLSNYKKSTGGISHFKEQP